MINDYLKLVIGNLQKRKLRSWLTLIGIFIGIAAVVSLISLGEGLRIAIMSQFDFLGTDLLTIQASGINFFGPPGTGTVEPLSQDLVPKLKKISGVETVFGRLITSAKLEFNDIQDIVLIGSVPMANDKKIFQKSLNLKIKEGRFLRDEDKKKVVLGNRYLSKKIFGREIHSGDTVKINSQDFLVVGILAKKGSFIFDRVVFMNEDELEELIDNNDEYNFIVVKVKDEKNLPLIQEKVEKLLRKERNVKKGEENFQVQTPQKALDSLNSTLFAVQIFIYIIAFISLIVGGIGIMNTMYTAVLERTREIGIMKAVGAKNKDILLIFIIESGLLGLIGGLLGILIGISLAYSLAYLGRLIIGIRVIQAHVSFLIIFSSLIFSFVLGIIFGISPAIRASRLQPVEALRE